MASVQSSVAVASRGTGSYQAALVQREASRLREEARLRTLAAAAAQAEAEDDAEAELVVRAAELVTRGLMGEELVTRGLMGEDGIAVGGWGRGEAPLQPEYHHGESESTGGDEMGVGVGERARDSSKTTRGRDNIHASGSSPVGGSSSNSNAIRVSMASG